MQRNKPTYQELVRQLTDERLRRARAEAHEAILVMNLREGRYMSANDNYPMGVDGSHPHFNQPDPPECMNRRCCAQLEPDWEFCPYCGWHIDWQEVYGGDDECS